MAVLEPLTADYHSTLGAMARVATHVLARRRYACSGRFGLRSAPGAIATPMFGDDETLRLSSRYLLRERRVGDAMTTSALPTAGATLRDLADFADCDLTVDFAVGHDTPALGEPDAPLNLGPNNVALVATWFAAVAAALDEVIGVSATDSASAVQLWPEHFDLAVDLAAGSGRANLGASPGDSFSEEPYVYVGPWDPRRPGDPTYWNVGFGAMVRYEEIRAADKPLDAIVAFFTRGLALLSAD